jgi:hypothetical protein
MWSIDEGDVGGPPRQKNSMSEKLPWARRRYAA